MGAVSNVTGVAGQLNDIQYFLDGGYPVVVPCEQTKVEGLYWAIPYIEPAARILSYQLTVDNGTGKPQDDAVHLVRVKDHAEGNTYFLLIGDSSTESDFINACNGCCGSTPSMPVVVIPTPILQDAPCADANGNYTFIWRFIQNPNALNISIDSAAFNGVYPTTPPQAGGYANAAAVLTWVQANWAAYGTWSLINSSTELELTGTTTKKAMLNLGLIPGIYIGALPSVAAFADGIKIDTTITPLKGGGKNLGQANPQDAINSISPYLIGTLKSGGTTPSLLYIGLQKPVQFYDDTNAVAGTAWTAGSGLTYDFVVPADAGVYSIGTAAGPTHNATFNGVAASPTSVGPTFATQALLLTWVQTNWAAYGTWSLQSGNTILRLVTTTVFSADVAITSA